MSVTANLLCRNYKVYSSHKSYEVGIIIPILQREKFNLDRRINLSSVTDPVRRSATVSNESLI